MLVMVDKASCSNDESLCLPPWLTGKRTVWQVTRCTFASPAKRASGHGSPQVATVILLWGIMETICHRGQTAAETQLSVRCGHHHSNLHTVTAIGLIYAREDVT